MKVLTCREKEIYIHAIIILICATYPANHYVHLTVLGKSAVY
jgi:hypothetical protein